MKAKVMTPLARLRAERREFRQMVRDAEIVRRQLAELVAEIDQPMPRAKHTVVLEGRVEGDEVVVED